MKECLKWVLAFVGIAFGSILFAGLIGSVEGWTDDLRLLASMAFFWPAWLLFIHYMDHHRD